MSIPHLLQLFDTLSSEVDLLFSVYKIKVSESLGYRKHVLIYIFLIFLRGR